MVSLAALWVPLLVSAALVFIVSSIIHMASPWHKGDYPRIPRERRSDGRAAPVEPAEHALAGVCREDEGRPGDDGAGDAERTDTDDEQPRQLVHLHSGRRGWMLTIKATIDGLLYACLTAGVFGWLWPR